MKPYSIPPGSYMKRAPYFIIPAYLVIGVLTYSNIFHAPFVFDDDVYIVNNMLIRSLANFVDAPWNRYLTYLTFALNYAVSGYNVFGYHLVNVLVHVANAVFVYLLVSLTFQTPAMKDADRKGAFFIAFATSLIFLVHPIQTQAVTYTTQRFASLAAFFYLLTIVLYARWRLNYPARSGRFFYVLAVLAGALAQLSKENAFTLPAMVVVYEFAFFDGAPDNGIKRHCLRLAPFLLLFAIAPLTVLTPEHGKGIADYMRGLQMTELQGLSSYDYLITQFSVIVTYLRLLVWPSGLRLLYEYPHYTSFFNYEVLLPFIFLAALFASGVYLLITSRRRLTFLERKVSQRTLIGNSLPYLTITPRRPKPNATGLVVGFGILWFFITISVESSIVPIKDVIFEHRVYLPSVGFFMAVCAGCYYRFTGRGRGSAAYFVAIVALVALSASIAAYGRNAVWATKLSLWRDTVDKAPNTPNAYGNLGLAYLDAGNALLAEKNYRKALELDPSNGVVAFNLASLLTDSGRYEESLYYSQRLRAETSIFVNPYVVIAAAYAGLKRYDEAIKNYKAALEFDPDSMPAHNGLAVIYSIIGNKDNALEQFKEVLRLAHYWNSSDAHYNLALLYEQMGKTQEAVYHYGMALKINPDDAQARERLAALQRRR
ncbi:MAG: tetratricopeptide repeat protein [Deltaproteobacteria bacterium]|nr:tetratricopeptide repeat protein [Deltaproteobacteria bacterium]